MLDTKPYRVKPGSKPNLDKIDSDVDGGMDKDELREKFGKLTERMQALQELMFAESKRSLLVVLQAMDAAGKDSTIRRVFGPLNPQGCRVWNFKAPTEVERAHDYLWRVHRRAPRDGYIGVFNRSHYEEVLIVRVKELAPKSVWKKRYDHINAFEKMLTDEGTVVLKFYLHISKDYQRKRLQRRLDRPDKHWKFNPDDLKERALWGDYREAFEDVFERCSTDHTPWYIVPAENRSFRNLLIAQTVVETLESLDMKFPQPDFDPANVVIE